MVWKLASAAYMSQTQEQQRFTIPAVAADWHELMITQALCRHPFPVLTDS